MNPSEKRPLTNVHGEPARAIPSDAPAPKTTFREARGAYGEAYRSRTGRAPPADPPGGAGVDLGGWSGEVDPEEHVAIDVRPRSAL